MAIVFVWTNPYGPAPNTALFTVVQAVKLVELCMAIANAGGPVTVKLKFEFAEVALAMRRLAFVAVIPVSQRTSSTEKV